MKCLLPLFVVLVLSSQSLADEKKADRQIAGLWEGALKVGAVELRLGFHISANPDGSLAASMDSIDQGAKDIPVDSATLADRKLTLELPKLKATYTGTVADDGKLITGEWKQRGATFPLELKRVDRFSAVHRPQTPKKPYPYDEVEVVVENKPAGVKLAGTLTKPKGAGPFRTAILITGSGPQDRDETLFNHKPFLVLADHLSRHCIAVLRCDDRGTAHSTGDHAKATSADFASDIRAMLAYLKNRKDIKDVGLIGHSEGGLIATMMAADNADVAFVVLLAGTGMTGEEVLLTQAQALLIAMKMDEKALKWQRDIQQKLLTMIKTGANAKELEAALNAALKELPENTRKAIGDNTANQFSALLDSPWLRFFLTYDPRADLKKVRCPVLALNGGKDLQVLAKENLSEIEKALKSGGNQNATIREFPELNHLFQTCETGLPHEYGKIAETMSPAVLDTIAEWVNKLK